VYCITDALYIDPTRAKPSTERSLPQCAKERKLNPEPKLAKFNTLKLDPSPAWLRNDNDDPRLVKDITERLDPPRENDLSDRELEIVIYCRVDIEPPT
jgi:hypothetical protein